jgi:hypothetical protein
MTQSRMFADVVHRETLQIAPDAFISSRIVTRAGEICMTMIISQTAPSRSQFMSDAGVAL